MATSATDLGSVDPTGSGSSDPISSLFSWLWNAQPGVQLFSGVQNDVDSATSGVSAASSLSSGLSSITSSPLLWAVIVIVVLFLVLALAKNAESVI
jgi:hypothetical protein